MHFSLSNQDKMFVVLFAALAFVFSSTQWILWLNTLDPLLGFAVYYIVLFGFITIVSKMGLAIAHISITSSSQKIGTLMCFFAIEAILGWSSVFIQFVTTGAVTGASPIYFQCEDGVLVYLTTMMIPLTTASAEVVRWAALIISPAAIFAVGLALVKGKLRLR